ncbi:long-chain-fatty-acid--CoA ligase [Bacillus sp. ISL-47]|uniref:long-chain-fatty-acid--CoA ligase n=1 Tax=Bacillus sp. ISL-47 TaxID=2819130 RepID=UPI001BEBAC3F|nr:long-chain-fatty-acid--CoA ligase [Bacillus sp. ISL-47]MBT2690630.1 long-chain-fatty-acid--CoA ligase [Bacillus sp. ISL-47]MBT2710837.1 long-chain-fatty-acid--CoA ligase [Pseudomonas sp. ISL-84]
MDVGYITRRMANDVNPKSAAKIAIQEEAGKSWTYKELHRISNSYANKLRDMGVQKGDSVGILLYNCLEYIGLYFAIAKIGAIAVRLNFRLSSDEFEYALNDSKTKVLCFHSNLVHQLEEIRNQVSVERYICLPNKDEKIPGWSEGWELLETGSADEIEGISINMKDPVMLMYTSGTTGRPKGAIWTHETTFWFSSMQALRWKFTGEEVGMTTGPLYHVAALEDIALPIMLMGGTLLITKSKGFKIERILSVIESEKVTDCFLFPFMIYEMLNSTEIDQYKLENLNVIYTGGDPIMPWGLQQLKKKFPHVRLVQVYGLTEGTPIAASLDPEDVFEKSHTVGKPSPLTEIKIIDDSGNPLPVGAVGEIAIKSPAVSAGYWGKPRETKATFVDGWCKTGDLGKFDEEGFLTIAGRKKDMIRSGGENIYAAEIEDVLFRHEAVKEVSIIGIPDPKFIEAVCAVIVKKEGKKLTEEEVIEYCKKQLASYKKPKKVIFVDELPRTPSGKVQKFVLRNKYRGLNHG